MNNTQTALRHGIQRQAGELRHIFLHAKDNEMISCAHTAWIIGVVFADGVSFKYKEAQNSMEPLAHKVNKRDQCVTILVILFPCNNVPLTRFCPLKHVNDNQPP